MSKRKKLTLAAVLFLLISIPLTLALVSQQQNTRSKAAASTTLYFEPTSSSSSPITKNIGDPIDLDIYVDPGSNLVTFVRYQLTFDTTKVQLSPTEPITLNSNVFSSVEGPVVANGTVAQSVSIGSDPTKAIQKVTKIGTLHFKAIGPTAQTPTSIVFGNLTQSLSSGGADQAGQNILSSTTPANIIINGTTDTSPQPSIVVTSIPQPTINGTSIAFTIILHGIGIGGDNPNPSGNSLSNKNPLHPQRNLAYEVSDTNNNIIASGSAPISFEPNEGFFTGRVGIDKSVQPGNYNIKVKTDGYLRRLVPGIIQIKANEENKLPATHLVAADTNGDNFLNVIDYNALLDCGYGRVDPLPMSDANAPFNTQECQVHKPAVNVDVDDNGVINSYDYNLFIRELSVQNGD